jgi:hypothetical protein
MTVEIVENRAELGFPYGFLVGFPPAIQTKRTIEGGTMVRRRFQRGSLFKRGKREKVWVARWWEDVINADGTMERMRRSFVIGAVAELTTRRLAMRALSERLRSLNSGSQRPHAMRTLKEFVQMDWEPVVLPTLKHATQMHYKYMLRAHLIPAFGERRLPDIPREAIQTFLAAKLRDGFAWETVHHIRCALSKVLGAAEEWDYISDNPVRKTDSRGGIATRSGLSLRPSKYNV